MKIRLLGNQRYFIIFIAREFQVFKLLSEGSSLADCASTLNLSAKTVSNHFTRVKAKLGVSSSAEMARMAIRLGLIEP